MAVVSYTITKIGRGVHMVVWPNMANGDTGQPLMAEAGGPFLPDKTVHVKGTFGVGGTLIMKGCNDAASPSYIAMTDIHANAASYQAESLDVLSENPRLVRPEVTAGDGTTSLSVFMLCQGIRPTR